MGEKLRVTQRSGRVGSARHNDRSFLDVDGRDPVDVAPHIDASRSGANSVIGPGASSHNLEAAELAFYQRHYGEACMLRNQRYVREGHAERCKSPEDLYRGRLTRPEELILQIGSRDDGVDPKIFEECVKDYLREFTRWNAEHGGHGHILNLAIHLDEATPHAHIRRVWDYQQGGITELGQNRALKAAGVPLPRPDQKEGRYNNRKITFDAMMRVKWQDICEAHGLFIERDPRPSRRHLDTAAFKDAAIQAELRRHEEEARRAISDLEAFSASKRVKLGSELEKLSEKLAERQDELLKAEKAAAQLRGQISELEDKGRLLSASEVSQTQQEARRSFFSRDKVIISRSTFESLSRTAGAVEGASARLAEAEELRARISEESEKITEDAKKKAEEIISEARTMAMSLDRSLELSELKRRVAAYDALRKACPSDLALLEQRLAKVVKNNTRSNERTR